MAWLNNDGLYLKFGTAKATPNVAGEYHYDGPLHLIEADLDLTKVTVTDGSYIVSDQVFFPKNAFIERVEIEVTTGAVGATAVLNLGLVQTNRTTQIDFNGFVAAATVASMATAGDRIVYTAGSSSAGALIGTVNSTVGYLTADYDTAAFTAGKIRVRIFYHNV